MLTKMNLPKNRPPTHPGQMLKEEFLDAAEPKPISLHSFAQTIGMSYDGLFKIKEGQRGVTVETAIKFAKATGTTVEFWLNLQMAWDLWHALRELPPKVEAIQRLPAFAGRKED